MSAPIGRNLRDRDGGVSGPVGRWWVVSLGVVALVGGVAVGLHHRAQTVAPGSSPGTTRADPNMSPGSPKPGSAAAGPTDGSRGNIAPVTTGGDPPTGGATPAVALVGEPTQLTRQWVNRLIEGTAADAGLNPAQATRWKQTLQSLIQQGAVGIPAIQEFLRKNQDFDFGPDGGEALGYPSLRAALFDALRQIGGPEAVTVSLEALQSSADPREVALLAKNLEALAPEMHRPAILAATRESLALAAQGQLEGRDVGPLFEVLEKYGGTGAVTDLEQAAPLWKYYATATLAQLPDGSGVPTLIRMVRESVTPDLPALETLARLSGQNPAARAVLLEQIASSRLTPSVWPVLSQALTGDEVQVADSVFDRVASRSTGQDIQTTHISQGNQNLWRMPTLDTMTPDQINRQVTLVDELLKAVGTNPIAVEALQQSRSVLTRRLDQAQDMANAPPP